MHFCFQKMILLLLHLCFAIFHTIDSVSGHSHNLQDYNWKNYVAFNLVLKDALITRLTDHSFLDCLKECNKRPRCLSVNYFRHFLLCELNHQAGSHNELQQAREGAVFIRKQDFKMDDGFPPYTGDLKMKYEEDVTGKIYNSVSDCGLPPAISNSKTDQSNGIGVYSKVVYKCEDGYKSTGRFKISCRENGQWSSTDFRCLKECGEGQEPNGNTCNDCYYGTYSSSTSIDNCEPCPTGQYQDQMGSTTCMNCTYYENPCGEPYQLEGTNTTVVTNHQRTECRALYDCKNSFEGQGVAQNVYVKCHRDTSNIHWTKPYLSCVQGNLDVHEASNGTIARTHGCAYQQQWMVSYSSSIVKVKYPHGRVLFCDHIFDGGNWTIIQQRTSGIEDDSFDRDWNKFKTGFGSINNDYWIGNEMIHKMTKTHDHDLLILLWKLEGEENYTWQQTARYKSFTIKGNEEKYKIQIAGYEYETSDAGDVMSNLNGYDFSTKDHDSTTLKCSVAQKAGWWHKTWWHETYMYHDKTNTEKCTEGGNVNALKWGSTYDKSMILIRPKM